MKITTISEGLTLTSTGTSVVGQIPVDSAGGKPRRIRVTASGPAYVKVGVASDITAVAGDLLVQPGDSVELNVGGCSGIAVKSVTGTASIVVRATEHGKWNYVSGDTAIDAVSILRRYGTNAHVYLPGIGTISGLTAGNYLLTDGSTGLSAVDGLVGLTLDAAGTVGAELVTNGDFSAGTTGWNLVQPTAGSVAISGGGMRINSTDGTLAYFQHTSSFTASGSVYKCTFDVTAWASGSVGFTSDGSSVLFSAGAVGSYSFYFTSSATAILQFKRVSGVTDITIDNISVKQVTGIHATASGAARPTLRLTNGKYAHEFAGAQSLALGSVLFQQADDHAVIAGVRNDVSTTANVFSQRGAAGIPCVGQLGFSANQLRGYWRDDVSANIDIVSGTTYASTPVVGSLRSVGGVKVLRANGVQKATASTALGTTTLTNAAIGFNPVSSNEYVTGTIGPVIAIKGTVSDADLLTLERFVASLTPNGPTF